MIKEIKFNKKGILLRISVCLLILLILISILFKPEIYSLEILNTTFFRIFGTFTIIHFLALNYSFFQLYSRKNAFLITDKFFIDNSRYESLGKIEWKNINTIYRINNKIIQIYLDKNLLANNKMNFLKKYLSFMNNWNYKDSIIISSAFTECNIEELLDEILNKIQNQKNYS